MCQFHSLHDILCIVFQWRFIAYFLLAHLLHISAYYLSIFIVFLCLLSCIFSCILFCIFHIQPHCIFLHIMVQIMVYIYCRFSFITFIHIICIWACFLSCFLSYFLAHVLTEHFQVIHTIHILFCIFCIFHAYFMRALLHIFLVIAYLCKSEHIPNTGCLLYCMPYYSDPNTAWGYLQPLLNVDKASGWIYYLHNMHIFLHIFLHIIPPFFFFFCMQYAKSANTIFYLFCLVWLMNLCPFRLGFSFCCPSKSPAVDVPPSAPISSIHISYLKK